MSILKKGHYCNGDESKFNLSDSDIASSIYFDYLYGV